MADEHIAVVGAKLQATGAPWVPGTPNGIPVPVPTFKAGDLPTLGMTLPFVASGCTMPAYTFVSGGGAIVATSICQVNSTSTLRKNDMGSCTGGFTLTATPFTPLVCSCSVKISDAGQTGVKCN